MNTTTVHLQDDATIEIKLSSSLTIVVTRQGGRASLTAQTASRPAVELASIDVGNFVPTTEEGLNHYCANCGRALSQTVNSDNEPLNAHIEIGEYCYEEDTFEYETDASVAHCEKCNQISLSAPMPQSELKELGQRV